MSLDFLLIIIHILYHRMVTYLVYMFLLAHLNVHYRQTIIQQVKHELLMYLVMHLQLVFVWNVLYFIHFLVGIGKKYFVTNFLHNKDFVLIFGAQLFNHVGQVLIARYTKYYQQYVDMQKKVEAIKTKSLIRNVIE